MPNKMATDDAEWSRDPEEKSNPLSARRDDDYHSNADHRRARGPLGIHHFDPQEYLRRRKSSARSSAALRLRSDRTRQVAGERRRIREWLSRRPRSEDDEPTWWFASIAIPLLAATLGPLANVLSIAALVTYWRMCLVTGVDKKQASACAWDGSRTSLGAELDGTEFKDPRWCYNLNIVSLVFGFVGNFFLLCNFTNRIRYVIALPGTIICWYIATGILIGITVSMQIYTPPIRPQQTYTQGFWYAILAAFLYLVCAMGLMINMLGFWLGHYPHRLTLTDSQRTLILQTMIFFIWLAAGGAIFSAVEHGYGDQSDDNSKPWSFVDALYFSDVTILTVGFGDLYPQTNVGRGLVFPYSVSGIVILGLMISSINGFVREIGTKNVIKSHTERTRARTIDRTARTSFELRRMQTREANQRSSSPARSTSGDDAHDRKIEFQEGPSHQNRSDVGHDVSVGTMKKVASWAKRPVLLGSRTPKLVLLKAEKDRFEAMRQIQESTSRFKRWYSLLLSSVAFASLWTIGAVVFWQAEKNTANQMTYFKALYFGYVSLLTIGYGDLAPQSNAGRPFFVFWSLIAVPTMTILVGYLSDTIVKRFKDGTSGIADFTVLPQRGVWRDLLNRQPRLLRFLQARKERKEREKREQDGLPYGADVDEEMPRQSIEDLAAEDLNDAELAIKLAKAIQRVSRDIRGPRSKKYDYEEWVEFTELIRFTACGRNGRSENDEEGEEDEGLIEWDWIGEDSPMMVDKSESEFVLDRLCESMNRYVRRVVRATGSGEGC